MNQNVKVVSHIQAVWDSTPGNPGNKPLLLKSVQNPLSSLVLMDLVYLNLFWTNITLLVTMYLKEFKLDASKTMHGWMLEMTTTLQNGSSVSMEMVKNKPSQILLYQIKSKLQR